MKQNRIPHPNISKQSTSASSGSDFIPGVLKFESTSQSVGFYRREIRNRRLAAATSARELSNFRKHPLWRASAQVSNEDQYRGLELLRNHLIFKRLNVGDFLRQWDEFLKKNKRLNLYFRLDSLYKYFSKEKSPG